MQLTKSEENDCSLVIEPFPKLPAQVAVIGPRKSGQTTIIGNLFAKFWIKFDGSSAFDYVIIFSPTSEQDPTFKYLKNHPMFEKIKSYQMVMKK